MNYTPGEYETMRAIAQELEYEPIADETPRRVDVHHHRDDDGPRINVSVEKNSKGYNWSATVTGARSVQEAINLIAEAEEGLKYQFSGAE